MAQGHAAIVHFDDRKTTRPLFGGLSRSLAPCKTGGVPGTVCITAVGYRREHFNRAIGDAPWLKYILDLKEVFTAQVEIFDDDGRLTKKFLMSRDKAAVELCADRKWTKSSKHSKVEDDDDDGE